MACSTQAPIQQQVVIQIRAQKILRAWRAKQTQETEELQLAGQLSSDTMPASALPTKRRGIPISTMQTWFPAARYVEAITPSSTPPAFPEREVVLPQPVLEPMELEVRHGRRWERWIKAP